jgi:hypothetical protein
VPTADVAVLEVVDITSEVTGADELVFEDMLGALDGLSGGPPFVREEVALELGVLGTAVDCDLAVLDLVVMAGSEVRSALLDCREEVVCNEAELWLDDERSELVAVWLKVSEVLKPDVEDIVLMDSMKDKVNEEVVDVETPWELEMRAPASLEYLEDDTGKALLDCGMRGLEKVNVATGLGDDCPVADDVVGIGVADSGIETERLVEKVEADWVVHVALSLGG